MQDLDAFETLRMTMALITLNKHKFYLFYNTVAGMMESETHVFRSFTGNLSRERSPLASVIYITTDSRIRSESAEDLRITPNLFWKSMAGKP